MGHNMENLVGAEGLELFKGVILSPVDRGPAELERYIPEFRAKGEFDLILDPQIYCARSEYRNLPKHDYFPSDIETTDLQADGWWKNLARSVAEYGAKLKIDAVASPLLLPNRWSADYHSRCAQTFNFMQSRAAELGLRAIQSICVNLKELSEPGEVMRVASIATSTGADECYLSCFSDFEPRREICDSTALANFMHLIALLERNGCKTLVSPVGSDVVLMKAAGASRCGTGKNWNLRRFTRSRFEEGKEGGRIIPYWFEHGLMAFLREADIARLRRKGKGDVLMTGASNNQFSAQILEQLSNPSMVPWVALSWKQYLNSFAVLESTLSTKGAFTVATDWLTQVEKRWLEIQDARVLFEEPRNDGSWVRKWRLALADFEAFASQ